MLSTALHAASRPTTQAGQTEYSTRQALAAEFVNEAFKQLKAIFPAWTAALKTQDEESEMRRQWLRGFVEAQITSWEEIHAGLAMCRSHNSPFLPSIGQFIQWCRIAADDLSGLPSESEALSAMMQELARPQDIRDWTRHHPTVFMAYRKRQSFDWKTYSYRDLKLAFSDTWAEVKKIVKDGFDFNNALPKPADVKANYTETPISKEVAAKKTSELLSMFGVDAEKVHHDNSEAKARLDQARKMLAGSHAN